MKLFHLSTDKRGFTLIELIVTLAIIGIVLSIAAFSFKEILFRNRVNTVTNELVSALNYARSEAVTRGQQVSVCRSANTQQPDVPGTPVPACSPGAAGGWEIGWFVFLDDDGDGVRDSNESLLRVFNSPGGTISLAGNANVADNVRYLSTGFLGGVNNGTIVVSNPSKSLDVFISGTGRIRTQ